jgi:hypothetical protein
LLPHPSRTINTSGRFTSVILCGWPNDILLQRRAISTRAKKIARTSESWRAADPKQREEPLHNFHAKRKKALTRILLSFTVMNVKGGDYVMAKKKAAAKKKTTKKTTKKKK